MKPITAISIFFCLVLPSLFLSYGNYSVTRERIIDDVNQALAKTIMKENHRSVTEDTLRIFRSNLKMEELKSVSYLSLCTAEPSKTDFCSDTMCYSVGNERVHIRAYPNCSRAAVFEMSEQTVPMVLFVASLLWGVFSLFYLNKKGSTLEIPERQLIEFGTLSFCSNTGVFYNAHKEVIYFTPMQQQLMTLLISDKHHRVSVDDICSTLWPGKDNAKETLYTLVRRLKPIVEKESDVRIVAEKGHFYSLCVEKVD